MQWLRGEYFCTFGIKNGKSPIGAFECCVRYGSCAPSILTRCIGTAGRVGQEGNGHSALSVGEIDRETPVAHSVFIHILKQNPGLHNKQSGKFTCIFRMDWQKMIKLAKMALQILTKSIYNGNRNDVYTRSKR